MAALRVLVSGAGLGGLCLAQARADVFSVAVDAEQRFLGFGPVVFPTPPQAAAAALAPWARLDPQDDYVVCVVGGRRAYFDPFGPDLRHAGGAALQEIAVDVLGAWPDAARAIPAHGDPTSFFFVEMCTSVPSALPAPRNVTLLGEAVHAMTPTLGRGANVVLRDAARLARALARYEAEMTAYGFDVVRRSAATGTRLMGQAPLQA